MCEKILVPANIEKMGAAFEKSLGDEQIYQAILSNSFHTKEMKKISIIGSLLFGVIAIMTGVPGYLSGNGMLLFFACVCIGIIFIIWMQQLFDRRVAEDKRYMKQIGTEEVVRSRKEILESREYKLAWILMRRCHFFNQSLDVIEAIEPVEYRAWAKGRMVLMRDGLLDEVTAHTFFDGEVSDIRLLPAIDRLRHFVILSPNDYLRAQSIEFKGRL